MAKLLFSIGTRLAIFFIGIGLKITDKMACWFPREAERWCKPEPPAPEPAPCNRDFN